MTLLPRHSHHPPPASNNNRQFTFCPGQNRDGVVEIDDRTPVVDVDHKLDVGHAVQAQRLQQQMKNGVGVGFAIAPGLGLPPQRYRVQRVVEQQHPVAALRPALGAVDCVTRDAALKRFKVEVQPRLPTRARAGGGAGGSGRH